jgi:putative oxidoreductase
VDALALRPLHRLAPLAPLAARVLVGVIMAVHGFQKLTNGPAGFAEVLTALGVPAPGIMAWVVTLTELLGGVLLVLGLFSRLAAFALTVDLVVAILLVKLDVGLIAPMGQPGTGYELDLALIAGFLVVLFGGPGPLSADRALGLEGERRNYAAR